MNSKTVTAAPELNAAIRSITERAVFAGARFGIAVYDVAGGGVIYQNHADEIFAAASTTKIPTSVYALALLGRDFRFRTRVVRCGRIDDAGTLQGDLVLMASGDPNLSGRVTNEDTLEFSNLDRSNGGPKAQLVKRNPLQVIAAFVRGVCDAGIRRVTGTVLIDISLFAEGYREAGTFATISPVVVNDNQIDLEVKGGARVGDPISYRVIPSSGYVRFIDRAITGEESGEPALSFTGEQREADGTWSVTISGTVPAGSMSMATFPVESPSRFARTLLVEALAAAGVVVEGGLFGPSTPLTVTPADAVIIAEHVSPPLSEATKIILKVSQNLHAEMLMPVIGATVRGARGKDAVTVGYACAAELLARWGIDTTGACQGDACGAYGYFSPNFMCRLLIRVAASDMYEALLHGLPVLGRDGTLWDIQVRSPAAGSVAAKTGTFLLDDRLHETVLCTSKALAGYVTSRAGRRAAFAIYLNNLQSARSSKLNLGEALGELATAIYEHA
jgi:PBP4 family serine-type D-alanyl-D-alanine carboxypeptidase